MSRLEAVDRGRRKQNGGFTESYITRVTTELHRSPISDVIWVWTPPRDDKEQKTFTKIGRKLTGEKPDGIGTLWESFFSGSKCMETAQVTNGK